MPLIRVLIAEDDQVMRAAIATLLTQESDLEVVGQVSQPGEMIEALGKLQPDVLLLVLSTDLPSQDTLQTLQTIQAQHSKPGVVALSNSELKTCVIGLLEAGAVGCVLKTDPPEMLVRAIRAVAQGEHWLSPRVTEILVKAAGRRQDKPRGHLTERELEVLRLMAVGYRNSQIAELLHVTEQTIKNHIGSIYSKLSVKTRVKAVLYAINQGLVPMDK